MRRIFLLVTVAAVMLAMSAAPAFAGFSQVPECQNAEAVIRSGGNAQCAELKQKGKELPKTSGVSAATVAPFAATLLLGAGVMTLFVIKRR